MMKTNGQWGDLPARTASAVVMLAVGAVDIWLGGAWFFALVLLLTGAMIWELARLTAPHAKGQAQALGVGAAVALLLSVWVPYGAVFLALPALAFALTPRKDQTISAVYAAAILLSGYGLYHMRDALGMTPILWLLAVVIASDVAGYFAGRSFGGPKFWPAISPKKTWSGTIAGWIGAALVGVAFYTAGAASFGVILLSPLVSFAGQLGDIAESWIKRRAGVKDASNLIPGHGGVLDRFDAIIGAMVFVGVWQLVFALPFGG